MTETELKLIHHVRRHFVFTTIITFALIVTSIIVAVIVYSKAAFLSGILVGLIPLNIQNWYEGRPSKYFKGTQYEKMTR